jgi:hypothetical protein
MRLAPEPDRPTDWGSLVADLSRRRDEPTFHVHDRTHVEFAIDYRLAPGQKRQDFAWETYFFAPESLRLDSRTYDKTDIYADLQSYVRFEVPDVAFGELHSGPLDQVALALASGDDRAAISELRLFACQVRAAGVDLRHQIVSGLELPEPERSRAYHHATRMAADCARITRRLREVIAPAALREDPLRTAASWVDEDVSRIVETLLSYVARRLGKANAPRSLLESIESAALEQARYRLESGLGAVGRLKMKRREVEALEFRRHVLKRFTSSVLWLSPEVQPAATWLRELLFAVAASAAMAFAIAIAFWNGFAVEGSRWVTWVLAAIVAYAVKDRLKATLQTVFASVLARHFPDRRWVLRDRERGMTLGTMQEQSGFVAFGALPPAVLSTRRMTRLHPLEEQARPETVLFHKKQVSLRGDRVAQADPRFSALTEIFRLDLARWLAHTDDPKRDIVFADPAALAIGSAEAPRVYNIAVVYRVRRAEQEDAPWHRLRVVVTRKGVRRIEHIA